MIPWLLGSGPWCAELAARCPVPGCEIIDVLDPANAPFFHLVNAANARAYAGLPMPAWVQLDCAALPAGMIGLGKHRRDIDEALVLDLVGRVRASFGDDAANACERWHGMMPLAEYTCVRTPEDGHVVGFSLYSLVSGLGLRTKAMALAMHGARVQTGIAQVDNQALRLHVALGPLALRAARVAVHPLPTTIVYALQVPPLDVLARIANAGALPTRPSGDVRVRIDAATTRALEQYVGTHAIVDVTRTELVLA